MASLSGNTVGYTKKATANAIQIIGWCHSDPDLLMEAHRS